MVRHVHHLASWQRVSVHATGLALLFTGVVWLVLHYVAGAGHGELPHPLEAWTLRLHALAALVAVFMLGALAAGHVPQSWRSTWRRHMDAQRRMGLALCALGAGLAISGYALMYLVPESARPSLGWLHTMAGLVMAIVLIVHKRAALRRRH